MAAALAAIAAGHDTQLSASERQFLYTPLMHSEAREHQEEGVVQFTRLVNDFRACAAALAVNAVVSARADALACAVCEAANIGTLKYALHMMREHADVVARFGHFPHRNVARGRDTTPEEAAWLASPDIPSWAKSQQAKQ